MDPDLQEIVKSVETAFDVRFEKAEISNESTFEDLYNALACRLGTGAVTSDRCLTSIVFWRLRRAMIDVLDLPKNAITPSTPIEASIPALHRRRTWSDLSERLALRLPGMEYPSWCAWVMLISSFVPFAAVMFWQGSRLGWTLASILTIPIVVAFLTHIAKPFATALPQHSRTVGETCRTMVGLNHAKLVQELGASNPTELRKALQYFVADMTGIEHGWPDGHTRLFDLVETTLLRVKV